MLLSIAAALVAARPSVYVNGLPLRQPAIVQHGVTYVPLRAVAEAPHCQVEYDKSARGRSA